MPGKDQDESKIPQFLKENKKTEILNKMSNIQ